MIESLVIAIIHEVDFHISYRLAWTSYHPRCGLNYDRMNPWFLPNLDLHVLASRLSNHRAIFKIALVAELCDVTAIVAVRQG